MEASKKHLFLSIMNTIDYSRLVFDKASNVTISEKLS